mmetsp:Transcript_11385/g.37936  ORF Transcript_11385/g.37936 Transcript_11385/m.37936 type:complete len:215 (-) Transcript_11385:244-888(-)
MVLEGERHAARVEGESDPLLERARRGLHAAGWARRSGEDHAGEGVASGRERAMPFRERVEALHDGVRQRRVGSNGLLEGRHRLAQLNEEAALHVPRPIRNGPHQTGHAAHAGVRIEPLSHPLRVRDGRLEQDVARAARGCSGGKVVHKRYVAKEARPQLVHAQPGGADREPASASLEGAAHRQSVAQPVQLAQLLVRQQFGAQDRLDGPPARAA